MARRRVYQSLVIAAACLPLAGLLAAAWRDDLGANPIETITHSTGIWALRLLLASLAITPLRRLTGWNELIAYRRSLGLLAFFYATLHLSTWVGLDHFFDWEAIREDLVERPFASAGLAAYACLLPLAITSTRAWIRRLGKRWTKLHRLAYAAAVAAATHYWWLAKGEAPAPRYYAALLSGLLLFRLAHVLRRRASGA